jgi:hypothetical protein
VLEAVAGPPDFGQRESRLVLAKARVAAERSLKGDVLQCPKRAGHIDQSRHHLKVCQDP